MVPIFVQALVEQPIMAVNGLVQLGHDIHRNVDNVVKEAKKALERK